jgi:hypothetical protein
MKEIQLWKYYKNDNIKRYLPICDDIRRIVMKYIHNKKTLQRILNKATRRCHLDIIKYIHNNVDNVYEYTTYNNNFLVKLSAKMNNFDILKYLHRLHADITSEKNYTIKWAIIKGNIEMVKYLYENIHNYINYNKLFELTAKWGHLDILKYLQKNIPANISINIGKIIDLACRWGHLEMFKYLYELNIQNINNINNWINLALLKACSYGHLELVKYLHKNGANIHAFVDGPINYAVRYSNLNVVRYLCENGANINDVQYNTIHLHICRYLIKLKLI